jgi:lysine 2,3-aminomutase
MRIKPGDPWTEAVTEVVERGRKLGKEVVLHTHFNHAAEATGFSQDAAQLLHERGIYVRNQSVLQRGVNDTAASQILLARRLSYLNVHPYYVYVHDLVKGVENLRTTVATAIRLEKRLRGSQAGFNTPTFVVDALGGGGKRDAHSFESYDQETGISVFSAPAVKEGRLFTYFDPLSELSPHMRAAWQDDKLRHEMIHDALSKARKDII